MAKSSPQKIKNFDLNHLGENQNDWFAIHEGRLAIDVTEDANHFNITSAVAGLHPDNLEVFVNHDMLTIRGTRHEPHEHSSEKYLIQECHWGEFSRSIILPTEIDTDNVSAVLKNGILTIKIPKMERRRKIPIETSL